MEVETGAEVEAATQPAYEHPIVEVHDLSTGVGPFDDMTSFPGNTPVKAVPQQGVATDP